MQGKEGLRSNIELHSVINQVEEGIGIYCSGFKVPESGCRGRGLWPWEDGSG